MIWKGLYLCTLTRIEFESKHRNYKELFLIFEYSYKKPFNNQKIYILTKEIKLLKEFTKVISWTNSKLVLFDILEVACCGWLIDSVIVIFINNYFGGKIHQLLIDSCHGL